MAASSRSKQGRERAGDGAPATRPRPRAKRPLAPLRYEFVGGYRGSMAKMQHDKVTIYLAQWPASLYELYDLRLLGPNAMAEVEAMRAE